MSTHGGSEMFSIWTGFRPCRARKESAADALPLLPRVAVAFAVAPAVLLLPAAAPGLLWPPAALLLPAAAPGTAAAPVSGNAIAASGLVAALASGNAGGLVVDCFVTGGVTVGCVVSVGFLVGVTSELEGSVVDCLSGDSANSSVTVF